MQKSSSLIEEYNGASYQAERGKRMIKFYTICSRLFNIQNPNQDVLIRAVTAATVARET